MNTTVPNNKVTGDTLTAAECNNMVNAINSKQDGLALQVPFTSNSGIAINWQTDVPTGQVATYAELFGNSIPRPTVYEATGVSNEYQRISFDLKYTIVAGLILTVTFDWAISRTGLIIF